MKRAIKFRFAVILSIIWLLILTNSAFSQDTLDEIKAALKASGAKWTPKESWVTRLSPEKFRKLLGAGAKPLQPQIFGFETPPMVMELPTYVDWTNREGHNWVTSIKHQGEDCGSCVAFAVLAALESRICIEKNRPDEDINLSEMDIFNCGGGNCTYGWNNYDALLYLWNYGAPDEVCWPYQPEDIPCSNTCANRQLRATYLDYYYIYLVTGEYYCKNCVANSPIIARMAVYSDFKWWGGGEPYEPDPFAEFEGYHSVCIVGYDDSAQTPYWIVKNSWGEDWGEDGFFRIKMGTCGIEYGAGEGNYWFWNVILPLVPTAPSNLSASAISYNQVNLSWNDISNNEIGYEIHRKKAGDVFSLIATLEENANSYVDNTGLEEGTLYYYQVKPYNIGGKSSSDKSVTTILRAPTNLDATVISSAVIRVTWKDNPSTENGFKIWEKKGSESWQLKSTVGANVTSKDITGLEDGTTYCYRVRAYNSYTTSAWSNTDCDTIPLNAPSNLDANAVAYNEIDLNWQDNSNSESGFEIWQQKEGGSWQLKSTVGANVTSKDITGLEEGTTYCYKVRAYSSYGNSDWSNIDCDTTPPCPPGPPEAPSNLVAYPECFQVLIWWEDNSDNEQGFKIERRRLGTNFVEIDQVGPNSYSYGDVDLMCSTIYLYRVRAYNSGGDSPYSNIASTKTTRCRWCGFLSLEITPDKEIINSGESVTYIYAVENKGKVDLTGIELIDDKLGKIATKFTLKKGERKTFTKTVTLTETTNNFAEATAIYHYENKTEIIKSHANAIVEVRK